MTYDDASDARRYCAPSICGLAAGEAQARMIASLPLAVTVGYLPRPAQQGSAPQIGVVPGEVCPAGNQQQQPLQSIHVATCGSGVQTALHDEESPPAFDFAASIVPVDPLEPDPLSSLEGPPVPLELLLQAASPAVDDAPMTTMTWKSFSIFMKQPYPPIGELGT